MTRQAFLKAYEAMVVAKFGNAWASDQAKLDHFMIAVEATLAGPHIKWAWDGTGSLEVWRQIGGKGKLTLKALRALPVEAP